MTTPDIHFLPEPRTPMEQAYDDLEFFAMCCRKYPQDNGFFQSKILEAFDRLDRLAREKNGIPVCLHTEVIVQVKDGDLVPHCMTCGTVVPWPLGMKALIDGSLLRL